MNKILFILKRKEDFNATVDNHIGITTGLYNSASFVSQMLTSSRTESNMIIVTDNNDIDRVVKQYKPTHVIIEALWVVPTKFIVLTKLHPTVKWIIRLHSEMPFMAGEGIAMDWIGDYVQFKNVTIACNAPRMLSEVRSFLTIKNSWSDYTAHQKVRSVPVAGGIPRPAFAPAFRDWE